MPVQITNQYTAITPSLRLSKYEIRKNRDATDDLSSHHMICYTWGVTRLDRTTRMHASLAKRNPEATMLEQIRIILGFTRPTN